MIKNMTILVSNRDARRIFLNRQGLASPPNRALTKAGLLDLITKIGFVQVDSISTVERAHHMILHARSQTYRPEHLTALLEKDGALFEHWTHDASIIPSAFFVYWKHRFASESETLVERWRKWREAGFEDVFDDTLKQITETGRVLARDFKYEDRTSGGWWNWHPSKTALEYLWRTGRLAIAGRDSFQKIYDLTERVIPETYRLGEVDREAFIDWCCRAALERLGFATHGELAAFFALISPEDARQWVLSHAHELQSVVIEPADGSRPRAAHALAGFPDTLGDLEDPPARLRVLSPFDPLLRDRARTERLFGFTYRIEIFVPEPKRQYGYYVFPLLEGDRLIGRIDMKANRKAGLLEVKRLWWEPGIRASSGRDARLDAELARIARFAGVEQVVWLEGARG
ncbi:hypothetical protein C8J33_1011696 [Rhizobium sp. PP-CC-3G-465]|nr:hypothetical protein C8J33_1011696 [Rhizobium sp. PP-CC-3G-465]